MTAHRLTGSRTDLAMAGCMYWARADVALPEDVAGPAADAGTRLHLLAEQFATTGATTLPIGEDIAARWEHLRAWLAKWRASTEGQVRLVETAWRLDVFSGAIQGVPRSAGRDYGHMLTEVAARLDLGAVYGNTVDVWDIKTGYEAPCAAESGQLKTLALLAATAFAAASAIVHIVHVRDDGVSVDTAELEQWDLDAHELMLRQALASLPTAQPQPGSHCKWCPARTVCPSVVSAMVAAPSMTIDSVEDVARIWPLLGPIEDAIAALKARARDIVEAAGEVPLANGKRLRMVRSGGGESINASKLARVLGGQEMQRLRDEGVITKRAQGSYVKETA